MHFQHFRKFSTFFKTLGCLVLWPQNLQRAVNRQPWLPRRWPVETRIIQHHRLHDDLNQHDEVMQHQAPRLFPMIDDLFKTSSITTMSHVTLRMGQPRLRTIYFRCSTSRRRGTAPDIRDSSTIFICGCRRAQ